MYCIHYFDKFSVIIWLFSPFLSISILSFSIFFLPNSSQRGKYFVVVADGRNETVAINYLMYIFKLVIINLIIRLLLEAHLSCIYFMCGNQKAPQFSRFSLFFSSKSILSSSKSIVYAFSSNIIRRAFLYCCLTLRYINKYEKKIVHNFAPAILLMTKTKHTEKYVST